MVGEGKGASAKQSNGTQISQPQPPQSQPPPPLSSTTPLTSYSSFFVLRAVSAMARKALTWGHSTTRGRARAGGRAGGDASGGASSPRAGVKAANMTGVACGRMMGG